MASSTSNNRLLPARCSSVDLLGMSSRSSQVRSLVLAASNPGTRAAVLPASSRNRIGREICGVYFLSRSGYSGTWIPKLASGPTNSRAGERLEGEFLARVRDGPLGVILAQQ